MSSFLRWATAVAVVLLCIGAAVVGLRPRIPALQARLELWRRGVPLDATGVLAASRANDVQTLALLDQAGVALGTAGPDGETGLHAAAAADARQAAAFLLDHGVAPDVDGPAGTPLARALETGHPVVARILLVRGADANASLGAAREPALVHAARAADDAMMRLLLEFDADPDRAGTDGLTPIAHAAARDDGAMTRTLLVAGASADVTLAGGRSLLEAAIRDGDVRRVDMLLARGADPAGTSEQGQPLIMLAVALGDVDVVTALLDAGADLETTATVPVSDAFLDLLSGAHARYYLTKDEGVTPLMLAVLRGDVGMARVLLGRGASVGPTRARVKYPLGMAANRKDVRMMQVLLGRDPDEAARARRLVVSLSEQQARLHENDELKYETRVSTGRKGFPTPAGEYVITDKRRRWRSTIYDVEMPYFMRLSGSEIGLHQGAVPNYPASHGCIRLPAEAARELFARMKLGDLVTIGP